MIINPLYLYAENKNDLMIELKLSWPLKFNNSPKFKPTQSFLTKKTDRKVSANVERKCAHACANKKLKTKRKEKKN